MSLTSTLRGALAGASLLVLAACSTVGPSYRSPAPSVPAQTAFVGASSAAFSAEQPPGEWWRLYQDPVLDGLVTQALAANTDLRVAAANLAQARAVLREVQAGRRVSTTLGASASYGQGSAAAAGFPDALDPEASFDVGLDAGYQLDLFGGIRRAITASATDVEAVQAGYDVVRITVAAETARAYSDACGFGQQLQTAQRTLGLQEQSVGITRRSVAAGRGNGLDVARAAALLEQTRASIPTLEAQRRAALFRLSVLTGRPPAEFPAEADRCAAPPTLSSALPVGDGAGLLRRRPDVRQAERRLAAATERVGVATAELYPSVSLGASIGSTATDAGDLFSRRGLNFGLGPLISWNFPNRTVARARIAQSEAAAEAALAQFDGTWLNALNETESALTRYANELERAAALRAARDQSAEALRLARLRFSAGAENFLTVLDAERTLAQAEQALSQSQAQLSTNQVSVFLALGGGW